MTKKQIDRALIILAVSLIVAVVAGVIVWRTDWFQERAFPKEYWAEKVADLEGSIRSGEYITRSFTLSIAEARLTLPIKVAEAVNIAEFAKIDVQKATENATNDAQKEIEGLIRGVESLERLLAKDEGALANARKQLAKYE